MLIRNLLAVALLATPLASNAATLDPTVILEGAAKVVKALDAANSSFDAHFRFRRHRHRPPTPRGTTPRPGPSVPEPTAALLFGLGAVAVGLGIRRRR